MAAQRDGLATVRLEAILIGKQRPGEAFMGNDTDLNLQAAELLELAAKWISRGRWCQARLAVDVDGRPASFMSARAVKWCASGAVFHEMSRWSFPRGTGRAAHDAFERHTGSRMVSYNDEPGRTWPQMAEALRATADMLRRDEP